MSIFENEMFQWLNGGTLVPEENGFAIIAPPHSDFFQDPTGGNGTRSNAPFYYTVWSYHRCYRHDFGRRRCVR
ncbi:MAG: hypothetical protein ACLT0Y_03650 [Christensenellales bacterium]